MVEVLGFCWIRLGVGIGNSSSITNKVSEAMAHRWKVQKAKVGSERDQVERQLKATKAIDWIST